MPASPSIQTESLRGSLRLASSEWLYGVVDGARDLELAFEAKCLYGQEIYTLFEEDVAPALVDVAPHLIPIDPNSEYLEHWAHRLGSSAGILLVTSAAPDVLLAHLREIFNVTDEDGHECFLRFYDPRVIRDFLPARAPDALNEFFGPIDRFLVESADGDSVLEYTNQDGKAQTKSLPLPENAEEN